MSVVFYISAVVAVLSTIRALTQANAVRALLYLILSFLSVAVIFFILGAPFAAALEVITYAGAIMVLFVFVIMILNLGPAAVRQEKSWLAPKLWIEPAVLAAVLFAELIFALIRIPPGGAADIFIEPKAVGRALFGPYVLGVELASVLLLAGLIGAYHLGNRNSLPQEEAR